MADEIYLRYLGKGSFVFGIPARDLTRQDFDNLDKEAQELALSCGLYELVSKITPKQKVEAKEQS